ncbi:MAG: hypothetical protein RIT02_2959 [Planctomycetota bacterium]
MAIRVEAGTAVAAAVSLAGLAGVQWCLSDPWLRTVASLASTLPLLSVAIRRKIPADDHPHVLESRSAAEQQRQHYQQALQSLEETRAEVAAALQQRADDLQQREQQLSSRFARFHEFLEYPVSDLHTGLTADNLEQLGAQDRAVRQLLEQEAERVYEKIRGNGYVADGRVQLEQIRDEALQLIRRVAQIYRPDSENPLMEVSLEQLARAASRIWLHLLVLLEQLPLNVQTYSLGTLYSWVRRAVIGYGVYQKASPWLKYASRGLYAGRLLATASPLSLGAMWAASELGRRGAAKLVDATIDRQAVGLLQQLITVIGVEAAGIYGTGFRQRDPAWILGTELIELIAAFPPAGDSLRFGLQKVTSLPLLSEYDRIYLYRCLANHKSAGLQLAQPSLLSREQREVIAGELEKFYSSHIHGGSEQTIAGWRTGVEERLSLRLQLHGGPVVVADRTALLLAAAQSLVGFLQLLPELTDQQWRQTLSGLQITRQLPHEQRDRLLEVRPAADAAIPEPPPLDPASELVDLYLQDLACCAVAGAEPADELEQLAIEAAGWFRRSPSDMHRWLDSAWKIRLRWECVEPRQVELLEIGVARLFFCHRQAGEKLAFCYGGLQQVVGDAVQPLAGAWLLGLADESGRRRVVAAVADGSPILWQADAPLRISRISGLFVDDARLSGGASSAGLQLAGNLRAGRYSTWFGPLLAWQ